MHILDKFNIVPVPLNQLPGNNLPPVPKKDSILPAILIFTGIIILEQLLIITIWKVE